jgi:hypothetical protein
MIDPGAGKQEDLFLKTEFEYLVFVQMESTGRPRYFCKTRRNLITLGTVEWFGKWRAYVYTPIEQAVYSSGCLKDITCFMDQL